MLGDKRSIFSSFHWIFNIAIDIDHVVFLHSFLISFFLFFTQLPLDWIGGYGGGGLIHVPSGRRICRRSDENSDKYCSAGMTRKNLHRNNKKNRTKALVICSCCSVLSYRANAIDLSHSIRLNLRETSTHKKKTSKNHLSFFRFIDFQLNFRNRKIALVDKLVFWPLKAALERVSHDSNAHCNPLNHFHWLGMHGWTIFDRKT